MSRALLELAIGVEATDRLAERFGGSDLRVPVSEDSQMFALLADVVGRDAAHKLAKMAGGAMIYVPRNHARDCNTRNEEIRAMLRQGKTPADVAKEFTYTGRVSERHVYRILRRMKRTDPGQSSA